jgi:hypothetical protein
MREGFRPIARDLSASLRVKEQGLVLVFVFRDSRDTSLWRLSVTEVNEEMKLLVRQILSVGVGNIQ